MSYPLVHLNTKFDMFLWPQAYCDYVDDLANNSSWCIPNPNGAAFKGQATIVLKTSRGVPVVYTTDGSEPGPGSTVASGPITITATTTFKVQLADQSLIHGNPPTVATFERVA